MRNEFYRDMPFPVWNVDGSLPLEPLNACAKKISMKKFLAYTRNECIILHFADGDTCRALIKCKECGTWHDSYIRFRGIDSWELKEGDGTEARNAAARLNQLFAKKSGELQPSQSGSEKYGRIVGDIYIEGKSLAETIVEMGLAWISTKQKK